MHRWPLFLGLGLLFSACSPDPEPGVDVVAQVADQVITAQALQQFQMDVPALLRSEKKGVEGLRDYLDSMIDMELMLLEARERSLDQGADFERQLQREWRQKLSFEFLVREVKSKSDVPFEELRERFKKSKWNRLLALARIRTATEAEAIQALREVESGKPFEQVALERSTDEATARQGGVINTYYGRDNLEQYGMPLDVAEDLFDQEVNTLCGPYRIGNYYEVFLILQEKPAPASYLMAFAQTTLVRAFVEQRNKTLKALKEHYQPRPNPAGIAAAVALSAEWGGRKLALSAADQNKVLYHLQDNPITAIDLLEFYVEDGLFQPERLDSAQVASALEDVLLSDALFYLAALEKGLDQDSSLVAWFAVKERSMLIDALKKQAVEERMDLSEAAQRRYFEAHQDRFRLKAEIRLVEILVDTHAEAAALLRRVEAGEDMQQLAIAKSKRWQAAKNKGLLHLHPTDKMRYGALYTAADSASVGQLYGPLKIVKADVGKTQYAIFKVLEKLPPRPQTFEQAARRVHYWLSQQEEKRLFSALFQDLRDKHADKIILFEDRLQTLDADTGS